MDVKVVLCLLMTFLRCKSAPLDDSGVEESTMDLIPMSWTKSEDDLTTTTGTTILPEAETFPPPSLVTSYSQPELDSVVVEASGSEVNEHNRLPLQMAKSTEPEKDYRFRYEVEDLKSGLYMNREESSKDGVVTGFYSYLRPDNVLVTVTYEAGPQGFTPFISERLLTDPSSIFNHRS